ncbi:hypothetical protein HMPREF3196_02043 [Bifidobacterium bifidum]|uniref:Uncharacterized protein n=1 Tax=Bifidobacterium bifidum TaxID=1681 RepID=A0A133KK99_BIFBI|nr:hypothetical protein HMPREF3196_02043 [Bifidobacterium bifidum]
MHMADIPTSKPMFVLFANVRSTRTNAIENDSLIQRISHPP